MAAADDFLNDDPNANVKQAIAQRSDAQKAENESAVALLEVRLGDIFQKETTDAKGVTHIEPDAKKISQFTGRLKIMEAQDAKIAQASALSKVDCMIACAQLDILPNTQEQKAYLIPYGNSLQFQLGYKGLLELAYRSGQVKSVNTELVFEADEFEVGLGDNRHLRHKPDYFDTNRSDYAAAKAVYATAVMADGTTVFHVMSIKEIEKIRAASQAARSSKSPWKDWPEAMAKKTVLKQMLKLLPASTADNRFKEAIQYDDLAEAGKLHFNEDNSLRVNNDTVIYDVPAEDSKPKDNGVKNYAKAYQDVPEAELATNEPDADDKALGTEGMSVDELIAAINEMMFDMLHFDELQAGKIYEAAGTTDLTKVTKPNLVRIFNKLDAMVAKLDS